MAYSGANLNLFLYFKDHAEAKEEICTNYRNPKYIVDAGTALIKNNKTYDKKIIRCSKSIEKRIYILSSPHKQGYDPKYYRQTVESCLSHIVEYLKRGYSPEDILVMTRCIRRKKGGKTEYVPIVQIFKKEAERTLKRYNAIPEIDDTKNPHSLKLLSVHKCKGLQAKVVFILDVVKGINGFPSEREDSKVFEVVRKENNVQDQKEEERRLFYVAITRAEEDLFIYTRENMESEFLREISRYVTETRMNY